MQLIFVLKQQDIKDLSAGNKKMLFGSGRKGKTESPIETNADDCGNICHATVNE